MGGGDVGRIVGAGDEVDVGEEAFEGTVEGWSIAELVLPVVNFSVRKTVVWGPSSAEFSDAGATDWMESS